ncbi:cell wall-binding repeat-containing protein [Halobacillus sp. Nhm2S1]|uniref:cell wall-binding repeat-containing protein n=1 Tax=Halobacillus sp. Nhm2S1 TaxID=2866716 RepID=UPI001C730BC4|nr:cell wall-binding repeat-containing protein [Halobacillus sp. Nhm2S1]MBX0357684.1 cell wall-binding repeat-containing protein [Halobacillus sp. Nhm2S1]
MDHKVIGRNKVRFVAILSLVFMMLAPSFAFAEETDDSTKDWNYVALGDSLAYGIQFDNTAGLGYPDFIAEDLENIYRLGSFTKEYAVPGLTSEGLLTQLQNDTETQAAVSDADLITLSVGANDFLEILRNNPEDLQDPEVVKAKLEDVRDNYIGIMGAIRTLNPDAKVFVMGYYNPFYAYPAEQQATFIQLMNSLNQVIETIATQSGSGYVPTFDAIAENYQKYLPNPQNVHPGQEGYMRIAEEFWQALKPIIPISSERIAGMDRYETAVKISTHGWDTADTVIIARGDDFPDALAGAPLAYKLDAPILLTGSKLPSLVKEEIERLGAKKAVILGGEGAVDTYVEDELKGMGLEAERIGGKDRFETAAYIAAVLDGEPEKAVVANGLNFPDALSIASHAAEKGYPILLTRPNELPEVTETSLSDFQSSIVVGGSSVVSDGVLNQLPEAGRYSGKNRYETSAEVATMLNPADKAFIATGADFADALTGSVLAAKTNSTFLLVPPTRVDESIAEAADMLGVRHFTLLGGTGAIDETVSEELLEQVK